MSDSSELFPQLFQLAANNPYHAYFAVGIGIAIAVALAIAMEGGDGRILFRGDPKVVVFGWIIYLLLWPIVILLFVAAVLASD